MLINRFVGGSDIKSVFKTTQKLYAQGYIPILDYAKEASQTHEEVYQYVNEMHALIYTMSSQEQPYSIALKLSSFLPHYPYENLKQVIDHIINTNTQCPKYVFLDSESTALEPMETFTYNKLLTCYGDDLHTKNVFLYKTYQMYRTDSMYKLKQDISNFRGNLGIKLVRGAYHNKNDKTLYQEKIHTDKNYNFAIENLLDTVCTHRNLHVCFATHNETSVLQAITQLNHKPHFIKDQVSFAQLYGMADGLSANLATSSVHKVFKYVPYGPLKDTLPYLARRLYENYDILKYI